LHSDGAFDGVEGDGTGLFFQIVGVAGASEVSYFVAGDEFLLFGEFAGVAGKSLDFGQGCIVHIAHRFLDISEFPFY